MARNITPVRHHRLFEFHAVDYPTFF